MTPVQQAFPIVALALVTSVAYGASLSLGTPARSDDNGTLRYPVHLHVDAGEDVSGVEFHLRYNPKHLTLVAIEPGASAIASGKDAHFGRRSAREGVVLIMGLNQRAIASGVVAECAFEAMAPEAATTSALTLTDATLSDPYGVPIPVAIAHHPDEPGGATSGTGLTAKPRPVGTSAVFTIATGAIVAILAVLIWARMRQRRPHARQG